MRLFPVPPSGVVVPEPGTAINRRTPAGFRDRLRQFVGNNANWNSWSHVSTEPEQVIVTDEVVAQYIELQGELPQDDDAFKVSE